MKIEIYLKFQTHVLLELEIIIILKVIVDLELYGTRMDGPLKLKGGEEIIFDLPIILNSYYLRYYFIQQNNLEEIPKAQTILYVKLNDEFKNIILNNNFLCFDDKNKNMYYYKKGLLGLACTRESTPHSEQRIQAFNNKKNLGYYFNINDIILPPRSELIYNNYILK